MKLTTLMTLVILLITASACATTQSAAESPTPASVDCEPTKAEQVKERATADPMVGSFDDAPRFLSPTEEIAVVWLAEGKNAYLGELVLAPGTEVPIHTHQSEEYLLFMHGGGVMTVDGQEVEVGPGSVILVPADTEHAFVNGPHETVAIQVFASPEGAQRYRDWSPAQPQ